MTGGERNLWLGGGFLVVVLLNFVIEHDRSRPNREFVGDMRRSPAYGAFVPNPVYPDGKTLQVPPEGTIPRGILPLPYDGTPEDGLRAGEELASPIPLDDAAVIERGAFVYSTFCQVCHGREGNGDGPVALRGFPPPPSLHTPASRAMKDGTIFHLITFGRGNMSSYAAQVPREDRWKVIAFVRDLQAAAQAEEEEADR